MSAEQRAEHAEPWQCGNTIGYGSVEFMCDRRPNHDGPHTFYEGDFTVQWGVVGAAAEYEMVQKLKGDFVKRDGSHSPEYQLPDDEGSGGVW